MHNDEMIERLVRIERSNRRLRRWLLILTLAVLVLGLGLVPFSGVRNIVGRERVATTTFNGNAVISFWNPQRELRLQLGVVSSGPPSLNMSGHDERDRIAPWVNENDTPVLMLHDPNRLQGAFQADLTIDGRPEVVMTGPQGKGRIY